MLLINSFTAGLTDVIWVLL